MPTPNKSVLLSHLRSFAKELRDTAKSYSGTAAEEDSIVEVNGIARIAEDAANSIAATDRDYVHPATAEMLMGLAYKVKAIADSSTDHPYRVSLNTAATALIMFVLRYIPMMTSDGLQFDNRNPRE